MSREEFIGKLEMVYVGDRNAFNDIVCAYDSLLCRNEKAVECIDNMISNGWILEQAGTVTGYSPAKKCCKVRLEMIKIILQNGGDSQ